MLGIIIYITVHVTVTRNSYGAIKIPLAAMSSESYILATHDSLAARLDLRTQTSNLIFFAGVPPELPCSREERGSQFVSRRRSLFTLICLVSNISSKIIESDCVCKDRMGLGGDSSPGDSSG